MAIIILGLIVLIAGIVIGRNPGSYQRHGGPIKIAGVLIMVIGIMISSIIQIDAGQVGVKKLFGKVQNDVLQSGLHMINPLVEVTRLDIKTQNYTMSGVHDEGQKTSDDAIRL